MKKARILYIASEKTNEFGKIAVHLEKENYEIIFRRSAEMKEKISEKDRPQLILIDSENDSDSLEMCFNLREEPTLNATSIAILSAKNDIYFQIAAFNAGADDYILKPINHRVLFHKIKSLLRRYSVFFEQEKDEAQYVGDIKIDRSRYVVIRKNGEEIELPRKEFELLSLLTSSPKKVFTRGEILAKIWKSPNEDKDRTIDVHIRRLRKKLGDRYIKTVKGIGYSFQS